MLKTAIKAAKEAGKIILKYYGKSNITRSYKHGMHDAASILTNADIASEKKITDILKTNFPKHNIFSEEIIQINNGSEYSWHIDPIDGTANFSRNIPLFGISIGLIRNDTPILGVLYFPALELIVYAERGKGAFANGKKIKVSNRTQKEALYYSGGYYKGKLQIEKNVADSLGMTKIIDASSYELAQIAMGDAELYILVSILHDVTAGVIIIREAGGKVTDYQGKNWTAKSKTIVASNNIIHNEVIRILNKDSS